MAFIRTALIILALLIGWTALRHQGLARGPIAPSTASGQVSAVGGAG